MRQPVRGSIWPHESRHVSKSAARGMSRYVEWHVCRTGETGTLLLHKTCLPPTQVQAPRLLEALYTHVAKSRDVCMRGNGLMPEVVSFAQKYGLAVPAQAAGSCFETMSQLLPLRCSQEELQKLMHASAPWLQCRA